MFGFFRVKPDYIHQLQLVDSHVPQLAYTTHEKFVVGVVYPTNGFSYFAPISSHTQPARTTVQIQDKRGRTLSAVKLGFMFPVPDAKLNEVIEQINFNDIRQIDPKYADLLEAEYLFCKKNIPLLTDKAQLAYKIGKNPTHVLHQYCCDFNVLEGAS